MVKLPLLSIPRPPLLLIILFTIVVPAEEIPIPELPVTVTDSNAKPPELLIPAVLLPPVITISFNDRDPELSTSNTPSIPPPLIVALLSGCPNIVIPPPTPRISKSPVNDLSSFAPVKDN